jgi:glycerol-3-phosphate cytidylyltransferase-like family protein
MFKKASKLGYLIVNVVSDDRVKEKKGINRPLMSSKERQYIVNSLECVGKSVSIPSDPNMTLGEYQIRVIDIIRPDIFVTSPYSKEVEYHCYSKGIIYKLIRECESIDKKHSSDIFKCIK